MAVAAIAALAVLVAGGYFGYRMFAGEGSKQTTAAVEPPKAESPPAEAPKDAAAAAPAAEGQPANVATAAPGAAPAGGATSSAAAPVAAPTDTSALPGQPAVADDKAAQAKAAAAAKAQAKAAAATASPTPPGAGAPTTATPTPAPSQPGPAKAPGKTNVAQAAPQDRWQAYADEMTRCAKEDFFSRVVCQQKVRARYCEGYWGKVPQCPGNTAVDHGQ